VGRGRVAVSNLLRLLDLPDEVLALIEEGALSEGHGRALLMAEDHGERKRLAREAREEGWSVRVLEERARESNAAGPGAGTPQARSRRGAHPDQLAAAQGIAQALGEALGSEVRVRPTRRGYRAELSFTDPAEALALARSLRRSP
jgi:ParB family chromosome partitioning protein